MRATSMSPAARGERDQPAPAWKVDRLVPVAIILAVLTNCAVVIWGAAVVNTTVTSHTERLSRLDSLALANADALHSIDLAVARISERVAFLVEHQKSSGGH